jgi:predicted permease
MPATVIEKTLKDDLSTIWDVLKNLVFFMGIYLFFLGWLYLFFYFKKFGVAFSSISLDVASYYNYGFFALIQPGIFILFIVFAIFFFILYYNRKKARYSYVFIFAAGSLFFFCSFFVIKNIAAEKAMNMLTRKEKLNPIYFDFTSGFLQSVAKDSLERDLLKNGKADLARTSVVNGKKEY